MRRLTVWCAAVLAAAVMPASAVGEAPTQPAAPAGDAAAWMGVKGATAERLGEAVFDGHFMLYRAGPRGADPVVLVHGLGPNAARDWVNVVPALATAHEVWALDLPGFGQSDKGNHLYSPENYARLIEEAVAPRVGRPFTLVGHSMGAAVSLGYAAARPQRVKRLVLVDMAGILQGPVYAESLAKFGIGQVTGIPEGAPWLDTVIDRMMARAESLPFSREMVLNTPIMREKLLGADPNLIAAFALGEHDFSKALREVRAPTLLIWGAEDRVAPLRTGQLAAATLLDAHLEIVPNAGHTPMYDNPGRFNALLLQELSGRGRIRVAARTGPIEGKPGKCDGKSGARFTGDLPALTLIQCKGVEINNARIGELRVFESEVRITDSEIRGGLYALRSSVEITAGSVSGAPALQLQESQVDAAGTRFEGASPIARNLGQSPVGLRLSVAEVRRGGGAPRYLHETVRIAPGEDW